MEERRFDELTRALGKATTRRQVLKGLLGTAAGGLLASVGVKAPKPALAARHCDDAQHTHCVHDAENLFSSCLGTCKRAGNLGIFKGALGSLICRANCTYAFRLGTDDCDKRYGCSGNATCCDGTCAHLQRDEANCGACGHTCGEEQVCRQGVCWCRGDKARCGDDCVDLFTDHDHCGNCQTVCDSCQECSGGVCRDSCRGAGEICCNGDCVDPSCPEGKEFNNSACQCVCVPKECPDGETLDPDTCECVKLCEGQADGTQCGALGDEMCCDEQCVSTTSNNDHCGGCAPCRADQVCSDSICKCPPGTQECNGKCVDTDNDVNNCGQCGNQCSGDEKCCSGVCSDNCSCPPERSCGDVCCDDGQVCVEGSGKLQCKPSGCTDCKADEICCNEIGLLNSEGYTEQLVCKKVSEYKICPVTPSVLGPGFRDPWICCPIDKDCCGGTGYLYNTCGGDETTCCPAGTFECGGTLCCPGEWDTGYCGYNIETGEYYCN